MPTQLNNKPLSWRIQLRSFCVKWMFPVLLLVGAGAFPIWYGILKSRAELVNGGLVINPSDLDFGTAWQDSRIALKLPVRNPTSSAVEVANLQLSCGCTLVKPHAFTIMPGETRELQVDINLNDWPQKERHLDTRRFQAAIIPVLSGQVRQEGWVIIGNVSRLLKVSASTLSLPDNLVVGNPFPPLKLTATYAVPLESLAVECNPPAAAVTIEGGPHVYELQIEPKANLPVGPVHFDLTLKPQRKAETLPAAKLPISGVIHNEVEAVPERVSFGALVVGETGKQSIILASRSGTPFTVKSWKSNSGDITVEPSKSQNNAEYFITQRHARLGSQESSVTFVVRTEDSRELEVHCPISYHGIAPAPTKR